MYIVNRGELQAEAKMNGNVPSFQPMLTAAVRSGAFGSQNPDGSPKLKEKPEFDRRLAELQRRAGQGYHLSAGSIIKQSDEPDSKGTMTAIHSNYSISTTNTMGASTLAASMQCDSEPSSCTEI